MSEVEEIQNSFQKLITKIKHNHDIKEHDKNALLHVMSDLQRDWISTLKKEETLPEVDLSAFDKLHTGESKSFKKLVHDTGKSLKKLHKEYVKHHPEAAAAVPKQEKAPVLERIEVHVDEALLLPEAHEDQQPDLAIYLAATSSTNWEESHSLIMGCIDREQSIIKLCYLIHDLLVGKVPPDLPQDKKYFYTAQEAILQECGRKLKAGDMQMSVTDIKQITAFSHFLEVAIKQVPTLEVPLRLALSGIKNLLGE